MADPHVVASTTYTFTWDASQLESAVDRAVEATALELASRIETYLHATLHRWTGAMAAAAYGRASRTATGWLIRGGSDTDHTFWHEVRWHPQLRQALDLWGPEIGPTLQKHLPSAVTSSGQRANDLLTEQFTELANNPDTAGQVSFGPG